MCNYEWRINNKQAKEFQKKLEAEQRFQQKEEEILEKEVEK